MMEQVYIIDDDKANNFLCRLVLEDSGINKGVHSFYLVNTALDTLKQAVEINAAFPELILLDINLPGADGWDFLHAFRKFPEECKNSTKIFLLSSSIYPDDAEKAKDFPEVVEFLPKPLTVEEVERLKKQYFAHAYVQ